ncbi:hypothetical protein PENTCL1PPCAC_8875 [Pristionchus entomophagus]|uniref:Jip-1 n=1 Tax=Pristionchus entomophagus TaxID=358040 RepID=A0AAV5T301_9BILA|nr:hypothetical protein PENTCL1PPCAC_8875 [Pristionchus entomophagus]
MMEGDRCGTADSLMSTDDEEIAIEAKLKQLPPAPSINMMSKSRSAYAGLSGSATCKPDFDCGGDVSSSDEDSDAEFHVHPSLKGLTKTRSEYSVPRIRAKPSDFELNLSRMLRSTEKFMKEETEMPIPAFGVSIDQSWPEPDAPKKKTEQKKVSISCWSSPPNLFEDAGDEMSLSEASATCWSAPDISNEYSDEEEREEDESGEEEEDSEDDGPVLVRAYMRGETGVRRASSQEGEELIFADSYPVIDTTDPDSSLSTTPQGSDDDDDDVIVTVSRRHDNDDEVDDSRPVSPTFDAPPPRPVAAIKRPLCHLGDSQDGDDCRPTKDLPSPPPCSSSSSLRLLRSSLHDSAPNLSGLVPREKQRTLADKIERTAVPDRPSSLLSSDHSALDDEEKAQLREREDWLERGSRMQLCDYDDVDVEYRTVEGGQEPRSLLSPGDERLCRSEYGQPPSGPRDQRDFYETAHAVLCAAGERGEMRRSTTTDAFRRAAASSRRRLPQRPDHAVGYHDHMPSSISMYERSIRDHEDDFDYRCGTAAGFGRRSERAERTGARQGSIRSLREEHAMRSRTASARDLHLQHPQPVGPLLQEDPRMSGSWEYRDHRDTDKHLERIPLPPPPNQVMNRPPDLAVRPHPEHASPSIRPLQLRGDHTPTISELKTPISPNVLPSPAGSGRRLPQLPLHHHTQGHSSPPFLYRMNNKEEHRLCYGMDQSQSGMFRSADAAEYEEDGLNGNSSYGVYHPGAGGTRKTLFSMDDSSGVSSCTNSDHQIAPSHRAQSAFHARHHDEVTLEIGDAIRVDRQFDDHWSQGMNLRSGQSGIFPSALVVEIDVIEEICQGALPTNTNKVLSEERDTFYLTLLASIEVGHHKGNDVLVQAMNKVLAMYKRKEEIIVPQTVLMEISFRGIHIIDKKKKNFFQCPSFDFFYSLQNISFCGAHPKQLRYFGFITKHPLLPRFACHVFLSNESTQPIVESIGRAFKRSYDEYMAFAHPTEDIYLE